MRKTSKGYGKQRFLSLYREPRFNRRFPFSSCAHCAASCDAAIEAHSLKNYVGALDKATTSTRFMVFDQDARVVAVARKNTGKSLTLRWLLQNIPGAREQTASGDLLFGNVDT